MPVSSRISGRFPSLQAVGTLFPGRSFEVDDKRVHLEDLYLVPDHPLRRGHNGRTFVYYQDTSLAGLIRTWEQEKGLETPKGSYEHIKMLGYHELEEGDAVFSRSLQGDDNPAGDVIQVWVADGTAWTPEMKQKLNHARDLILGPRADRYRTRPKTEMVDGKPVVTGGTAFERSSIAKSVKEPARSYTTSVSLEAPTSIMGPVASGKVRNGLIDPAVEHRAMLHEAVTPFAMGTTLQGPEHVQHAIRQRSELLNKPRIGGDENWAFSTEQLNLAAAREESKAFADGGSLSKDLGFFGGAHIDRGDAKGFYSNITCNHDIPDSYDPGMFFILQLGVFIRLKRYSSINFFGHRQHGSTPPLCPTGQVLFRHAYRFVVISYPPRRTVDGTARVTLAALPNNAALIMPPEILHTGY
ncbi:hypothetical protein C8R45DRAFT_1104516 [Mycena sanguinolenta]|nr:hypothetical protein C8R45DRAFT_1104516 [Mycena sanguinolenta]